MPEIVLPSIYTWHAHRMPPFDDGRLALVVLRDGCGLEHYGDPVVVSVWSSKLKTTVEAIRIDREQVVRWMLLERPSPRPSGSRRNAEETDE